VTTFRWQGMSLAGGAVRQPENAMADDGNGSPADGDGDGQRIDVHDDAKLREWSQRLDATPEQLKEAVAAVGDHAEDVELHLKGSRSSTNSDRVADAS
jgi:hypothetical protein